MADSSFSVDIGEKFTRVADASLVNKKIDLTTLGEDLTVAHFFVDDTEKRDWINLKLNDFREYVKKLENKRRRDKHNLPQRPLWKAKQLFDELWQQRQLLPKKVKDRLKMIGDNWKFFTTFYSVKDCPATNNAIENYFSTSLKTHRKKQLRTDRGLINHMKLAALKRVQGFANPKKTILEIYGLFKLITV